MSSFGGTVKLTGETEYQKALRGITDNLKVLNSEMKVVTSQYDKNDKSTANLSQQNEVLNKKIAEQREKVNILTQALASAEEETGENSNTTRKWQTELNNAQAELNKLVKNVADNEKAMQDSASATDENTESIDDFGEEAEESGKQALKLGDIIKANLISDAIKSGLSALANGIKQVGSAFVNVGKQAIASYGEYEQLVGGVQTLFGAGGKSIEDYAKSVGKTVDEVRTEYDNLMTSQQAVLDNASVAYATAGLSANAYMETVTSFSASLLQSLGGDTVKSAELANIAIIDMSDNANKMGTSMESIQNAYQGFAKGNYTMLDNLKLGYGGTAREMARLVNESGVLGDALIDLDDKQTLGASLQEVGFAKMIEAIHIVQEEMGIMGTTSVEASGTITGSTGAMKSAWENLLTGIADDNADFEKLVDNLVVSIVGKDGEGGVLTNILPRISTALDGIVNMVVSLTETLLPEILKLGVDLITNLVQGISENLPALLESASTILNTVIEGIVTLLPELIPVVMQMLTTFITAILENLPLILQAGIEMLVTLAKGIAETLPELIPVMVDSVVLIVDTLLENIDLIIDAGIELIIGLADGLIISIPNLLDKIPILISKLVGAIIGNLPAIIAMGIELVIKLGTGLVMAIPDLVLVIPALITAIVGGLAQGINQIADVGLDLVKGLWNGIKDATGWLMDRIKGFGSTVLNGIKEMFGIHSPSTLFRDEVGKNLALGVGEGFSDTMSDVSADMANAIPTEFDANVHTNIGAGLSPASNYDMMVLAFKQALTEVKVEMNGREMGSFVTNTIERVVYA